jgi:hypothetical protein
MLISIRIRPYFRSDFIFVLILERIADVEDI